MADTPRRKLSSSMSSRPPVDPSTINEFGDLSDKLNYKQQAVWFMNGFWPEIYKLNHMELIYTYVAKFVELDLLQLPPAGVDGHDLDALQSAKFIEQMDEDAMTATERKEALRTIDLNHNNRMACIEYLTWKYKKSVEQVVKAPQGDNTELLEKAQAKMDAVAKAIEELTPKLEAAQNAAAEAKAAENAVKKAEADLQQAVEDLNAQETAFNNKISELEKLAGDMSLGVVKRGRAANEMEQLKSEDPLPLRTAKITQEAALRRVTKERKAAEEATAVAEKAQKELEDAYADLEVKMKETQAELEEVKKGGGPAHGAMWWMERELYEADRSLPKAKQRYDHTKPLEYAWEPTQ